MLKRVATAAIGLPVLIGLVWLSGFALTVLICAVAAIAAWELCRIVSARCQRPFSTPAVVLSAALAASGYFAASMDGPVAFTPLVPLGALVAAVPLALVAHRGRSLPVSVLVTVCIVAFVGGALFNGSLLAGQSGGRDLIYFMLAVTFATDTGAYAVGRTVGSRKLAPSISPGKTWEGAIGGLAAATLIGAVFALALGYGAQWLAVAAIMGVTGQIGDLYVSRLKRQARLDDSGTIFPGHGGMMDRLDSMSFNLIVIGLIGVPLL